MSRSGASARALDRGGRDVDLKNYAKTGEDEWGENYSTSTSTVSAIVNPYDEPRTVRDASGQDVAATTDVFVKSSTSGIRDGAGDGASEIDVDQDGDFELVVVLLDDQDNGLYRLVCTRKT